RPNWRAQYKRDRVLPDYITGALSHAGFRSVVGYRLKTERALVKVRCLFGIAGVKFNVICALKWQKIFLRCGGSFLFWSSNCRWHNDLLTSFAPSAPPKYKIDNHPSQGCLAEASCLLGRRPLESLLLFLWRGSGHEFLKARIIPERI